jgi:hypothetical protein
MGGLPESATVKLPMEWLIHPYSIPLEGSLQGHRLIDVVKLIAINNYGKRVTFCYNSNDFDLIIGKAVGAIELRGFADAEGGGRWTNTSVAEIRLLRNLNENDVVQLSLDNAFDVNAKMFVQYAIGNTSLKSIFMQNKLVTMRVNQPLENPALFIHIPKPISPMEIGQGSDPRTLGVKIKRIRIGRYQDGQVSFPLREQCI